MKIAVASLGQGCTELEATVSPKELELSADDVEFVAPVEVSVKVTRMHDDVLAEGSAHTRAHLQCGRCLGDADLELTGQFQGLYVPEGGAYTKRAGRRDYEWGDQRVNFYVDFTVDLTDEIRDSLLLEVPMKPLCRPECAGLCTRCGANLNQGPCGCEPDAGEDPFAPLRDLAPPGEPS